VVFTGWIFYGLGAASIFHYRRKEPNAVRPFRTPGYPLTPILFVVTAAAIVLNTLWVQPKESAFGIGILLLGLPAFWFWQRKKSAR
jgi:APA family basic amino acid/polyamine antiporter